MKEIQLPEGFTLKRLKREHPRKHFTSSQDRVDNWLVTQALQNQEKHLSVTKVLLDKRGQIAGYFTLATAQVDFGDLPLDVVRHLPRRMLPVAVLAWLGVHRESQGKGLGRLLLAQALRDCYDASKTFAIIAVILDCLNDDAKTFYQHWDFQEIPGNPYRLFLGMNRLEVMMQLRN